jgi:hypothetical protein
MATARAPLFLPQYSARLSMARSWLRIGGGRGGVWLRLYTLDKGTPGQRTHAGSVDFVACCESIREVEADPV